MPVLQRCAICLFGLALPGASGWSDDPNPPSGGGRADVTVLDAAGQPVSDATLSVLRWDGNWNETGVETRSDAQGKASLSHLQVDVYLGVRVVADGLATTMFDLHYPKPGSRELTIKLSPPVRPSIQVLNSDGTPIHGAEIHRMEMVDSNKSAAYLTQNTAHAFHHELSASDENGRLLLPALPQGARLAVTIGHPDWKNVLVKDLIAADGEIASVTMEKGVRVRIEFFPVDAENVSLDGLKADVKFTSGSSRTLPVSILHPYTIAGNHIDLTAYPCSYSKLAIELDDYFVTPYVLNLADSPEPIIDLSDGTSRTIRLDVRRKVRARGKVVDRRGKPMREVWVLGSIYAVSERWPPLKSDQPSMASLRREWGAGGDSESDEDGNFEIELAEGKAYVETIQNGFFNRPSIMEFEVDANGSTQIPTITMLRVPVLRGVVKNADGTPAGGMLVRMRSRGRGDAEPVGASADDGSFQLKMSRIPYRKDGDGLVSSVFVVAVDPDSNQAGIAEVDVSDPKATSNINLTLSERSPDWVLQPIDERDEPGYLEMRQQIAAELQDEYPQGLPGKRPPDLSEGTWLNSDARSLADLRGQHVLLDFWFIGCGPCIRDMPSVKMAQQMFGDQGFTVVAVHRKGQSPDAVRDYAKANKMDYPIVVDTDGVITEQYKALGVHGYPSYLLLDADGRILHNDNVSMPPSLRSYKLERIYRALRR